MRKRGTDGREAEGRRGRGGGREASWEDFRRRSIAAELLALRVRLGAVDCAPGID